MCEWWVTEGRRAYPYCDSLIFKMSYWPVKNVQMLIKIQNKLIIIKKIK